MDARDTSIEVDILDAFSHPPSISTTGTCPGRSETSHKSDRISSRQPEESQPNTQKNKPDQEGRQRRRLPFSRQIDDMLDVLSFCLYECGCVTCMPETTDQEQKEDWPAAEQPLVRSVAEPSLKVVDLSRCKQTWQTDDTSAFNTISLT